MSRLTPADYQTLAAFRYALRQFLSFSEGAAVAIPHSAVGLVDRLGLLGLARRRPGHADRRKVEVEVTARGERTLARLAAAHRAELRQMAPTLRRLLEVLERS
jgi:DNA-binding MarR family transcriptional regulator